MKFKKGDLVRLKLIKRDYLPIDFRTYNNKIGIYFKPVQKYRCIIYIIDPISSTIVDFILDPTEELIKI